MTDKEIQNLRDRFASVKKRFIDWYGCPEPQWDKEAEDKMTLEELISWWENRLANKETGSPTVYDQSAFGRFEKRAKKELNL